MPVRHPMVVHSNITVPVRLITGSNSFCRGIDTGDGLDLPIQLS